MNMSTEYRLRWLPGVTSPDEVLRRLGKSRDQAWMFYDMHRESFYEKEQFWKYLGLSGGPVEKADAAFITTAIEKAAASKSVFSIQLIVDWLSIGPLFKGWKREDMRVNTPGTMTDKNWSIVMPVSLEDMMAMDINEKIKGINRESGRI